MGETSERQLGASSTLGLAIPGGRRPNGQQEGMVIRAQQELCAEACVTGPGLVSRIQPGHGDPTGREGGNK